MTRTNLSSNLIFCLLLLGNCGSLLGQDRKSDDASPALAPFWRKPTDAPTLAPPWYTNTAKVTSEIKFDPSQEATKNGAALARALRQLKAGDVVLVHAGTYIVDSFFQIVADGTADRPVIVRGAPGERVVITRSRAGQNTVNLARASYLIFENLVIEGGDTGLKLEDVNHFMIYGCEIANTYGNAVASNSRNTSELYFIDNQIHNTGGHGEGFYLGAHDGSIVTHHSFIVGNWIYDLVGPTVNQGDGIEIKYGSYAVTIKNNFVRNTHYPGIMVYGTGRGAEDRNVIEENVVIGSHDYGMQISAEAIVRNNLIVGGGAGCFCSKPDNINPQYLTIVNNTFVNERKCVSTTGWGSPRAVDIAFANNALFAGNGIFIQNGTGNAVVAGNVELKELSRAFANLDLTGSELDAMPKSGSPLIGAGDEKFAPERDLFGRNRGTCVDAGAVVFLGQK